MLPSGYEYAYGLYRDAASSTSPYFDLGIVPTNTMGFDIQFNIAGDYKSYVFGSRNTNSTSSAGQLNFYYGGQTGTTYLGFAGARISLGSDPFPSSRATVLQKRGNEFVINHGNRNLYEKTGATSTFTGTRSMYLFAMNNAGSPSFGTDAGLLSIYCVRVYENNAMTHEFIPAFDIANNEQCVFDSVTENIITKSGSGDWVYGGDDTHRLLKVEHTEGGGAYIESRSNLHLKQIYARNVRSFTIDNIETVGRVKIVASAESGYSFAGWEKDGVIVSTDRVAYVAINDNITLTARFAKNTSEDAHNRCQLMYLNYGVVQNDKLSVLSFVPVISSDIKVDGISKTNSTIVCKSVPSNLVANTVVMLRNPKGKIIYYGVVKAINDNILTCREPISMFDTDFLFGTTSSTTKTIMYAMYEYMYNFVRGYPTYQQVFERLNPSVMRMGERTDVLENTTTSIDMNLNLNITQPVIDSISIGNLEDFLLNCFNEFGAYVTHRFDPTKYNLNYVVTNPKLESALVLSDNSEAITNVEIDVQDMETTVLTVYNSTGSTFRGQYSVKLNGTITDYTYLHQQNNSYIGYYSCKPKIIMSDDKLNVLVEQYLSNAKYNHQIKFVLDLNSSLYSLDDFNIGRRVNFYYKDKMYESIITGTEFAIAQNEEEPSAIKIILGKVRNKLTTKINLGKLKK